MAHGQKNFTSAETTPPTIEDHERRPLGGGYADDNHQHSRLHHHLTVPPPMDTNTPTQGALSANPWGHHLTASPQSTNTPVHGFLSATPGGHLSVPVRRRRANHGTTGGVGVGTDIDEHHQQDYDDDHWLARGEHHQHQKHQEGAMGSGMDQRLHDLEPGPDHQAPVADEWRAEDASSFSPATKPAALGRAESGIGGGDTSAIGQPPLHSAELELLGRRKVSVKRSRKTATRPMSSVKGSMSWPPQVRSMLWRLLPLSPVSQPPSPHHPSLESGGDDKDKATSGLGSPDTSRDTSDAASQAPYSPKRIGGGQRLKRTCQHPSCRRGPSFSKIGQRAAYCAKHKLDGMVKAISRKCAAPGCTTGPSYGSPEDNKPVFCSGHRLPDHVNVISPRCAEEGCHKRPSFGCRGTGNRAAYCAKHKLAGMINVASRSCEEDGCNIVPSFGFEGERAAFCWRHKQDGQQNLISRRCTGANSSTASSYGKPGNRGRRSLRTTSHPERSIS